MEAWIVTELNKVKRCLERAQESVDRLKIVSPQNLEGSDELYGSFPEVIGFIDNDLGDAHYWARDLIRRGKEQ